jgi:hypothetical protein
VEGIGARERAGPDWIAVGGRYPSRLAGRRGDRDAHGLVELGHPGDGERNVPRLGGVRWGGDLDADVTLADLEVANQPGAAHRDPQRVRAGGDRPEREPPCELARRDRLPAGLVREPLLDAVRANDGRDELPFGLGAAGEVDRGLAPRHDVLRKIAPKPEGRLPRDERSRRERRVAAVDRDRVRTCGARRDEVLQPRLPWTDRIPERRRRELSHRAIRPCELDADRVDQLCVDHDRDGAGAAGGGVGRRHDARGRRVGLANGERAAKQDGFSGDEHA